MRYDFSYWSPRPSMWLPEYEPVGVHDPTCDVWHSHQPCNCKDGGRRQLDDTDSESEGDVSDGHEVSAS